VTALGSPLLKVAEENLRREDASNRFVRRVGSFLPDYIAPHHRTPYFKLPLCEPQTLNTRCYISG